MKHAIYLNRKRLKKSQKSGTKDPCISVKNYKGVSYAHEVVIMGKDNREAARVICRPSDPQGGNEFWIETSNSVYMIFQMESESEACEEDED